MCSRVLQALSILLDSNLCENCLIITDSKSMVKATDNKWNVSDGLISHVSMLKLNNLERLGIFLSFLSVPDHEGILNDKIVHSLAKNASSNGIMFSLVSYKDIIHSIQLEHKNVFGNRYILESLRRARLQLNTINHSRLFLNFRDFISLSRLIARNCTD